MIGQLGYMMEFEELMDKKELYCFVATRTSQCRILVALSLIHI